jgi:hypothetical protein
VKLDADQQHVLNAIRAGAKRNRATPMEQKAAVAIGLVESGLRNLPGGDADSAGWRQERASLYRDPTNLQASVDRVYAEMRQRRGKYASAGDLAAAVQRPAAQYRGRYAAVGDQAQKLLGEAGGLKSGPAISRMAPGGVTSADPSVAEQRQGVLTNYLSQRGRPGALVALAGGLGDIQAPAAPTVPTASRPGATAARGTAVAGQLDELYWQGAGGINVKHGKVQPQGFVSGHKDHVHAAADPADILRLAKLAQSMGLHVGENVAFGGVAPVHVKNSNHYATGIVNGRKVSRAIDVSGDPAKMRAFAHRVAREYGVK